MDVLQPPVPWLSPYDSTCEGLDWIRNHEVCRATLPSLPDLYYRHPVELINSAQGCPTRFDPVNLKSPQPGGSSRAIYLCCGSGEAMYCAYTGGWLCL